MADTGATPDWLDQLPRRPGPTPDTEYVQSPADGLWYQVPAAPKPYQAPAAAPEPPPQPGFFQHRLDQAEQFGSEFAGQIHPSEYLHENPLASGERLLEREGAAHPAIARAAQSVESIFPFSGQALSALGNRKALIPESQDQIDANAAQQSAPPGPHVWDSQYWSDLGHNLKQFGLEAVEHPGAAAGALVQQTATNPQYLVPVTAEYGMPAAVAKVADAAKLGEGATRAAAALGKAAASSTTMAGMMAATEALHQAGDGEINVPQVEAAGGQGAAFGAVGSVLHSAMQKPTVRLTMDALDAAAAARAAEPGPTLPGQEGEEGAAAAGAGPTSPQQPPPAPTTLSEAVQQARDAGVPADQLQPIMSDRLRRNISDAQAIASITELTAAQSAQQPASGTTQASRTENAPVGAAPAAPEAVSPETGVVGQDSSSQSDVEATPGAGERPAPGQAVSQPETAIAPKPDENGVVRAKVAGQDVTVNVEPTDLQKQSGNYQKGHVTVQGLPITIENPAGTTRSGTGADGKPWTSTLANDYGYIKRTAGADGDHVDVFMGPHPDSGRVYVIDQHHPEGGDFDEHKAMIGFNTRAEALDAYNSNYPKDWDGARAASPMSMDQFKDWLKNGNTQQPARVAELAPTTAPTAKAPSTEPPGETHEVAREALESPSRQPAAGPGEGAAEPRAGDRGIEPAAAEPITAYRGGARSVGPEHFADAALGAKSGHPSSGLGVFYTVSPEEAARWGPVTAAKLDLRNPKIIPIEELPPFDSTQEARAYSKKLERQGHDGIVLKNDHLGGHNWAVVFRHDQVLEQHQHETRPTLRETIAAKRETKPEVPATLHPEQVELRGEQPKAPVESPAAEQHVDAAAPSELPDGESRALEHMRANLDNEGLSAQEARNIYSEHVNGRQKLSGAQTKRAEEVAELAVVQSARAIVARGGAPAATFDDLVGLYERQPNLATRTSTSIEQQAYSTPAPLAYVASHLAGIGPRTTVLEPTAGNGMLLIAATPDLATVNELNPDRAAALRHQGFHVTHEDASSADFGPPVDVVIANPPFGVVRAESGASRRFAVDMPGGKPFETNEIDHAIALHALASMADHGRAVLIVGGINKLARTTEARSDAYNGAAKRRFYYTLQQNYNVTDHFTVAGELYEKQGAGWPVDVIVIDGRGKSSRALPAVDVPRVYTAWQDLKPLLEQSYERARGLEPRTGVGADIQRPGAPAPEAGQARLPEPARPARAVDDQSVPVAQGGGGGVPAGAGGREPPVGAADHAGVRGGGNAGLEQPERSPAPGPAGAAEGAVGPPAGGNAGGAPADSGGPGRPGLAPDQLGQRARPDALTEGPQQPYKPASRARAIGTLVPTNMRDSVSDALHALQQRVGPVDTFVANELGYDPADVGRYFSAEQLDALGLALDQMKAGKGFIIGDQTGIGKGRVVAGVIRWALKNGQTPIFITEKPNLYADIYRDLTDIAVKDVRPVMTDAGKDVMLDEAAGLHLKTPGALKHNGALTSMANESSLGPYNMIFSTYNGMQTIKGQPTPRMIFLQAFAPNAVVIFDESHNAGGNDSARKSRGQKEMDGDTEKTGRAAFSRGLAKLAKGVFYSSATYAKRPSVMDLYFKTDMALAVDNDVKKLPGAIAAGGVPLQQVVASMLSKSGQYIRRERSFDGVEYNTPSVSIDRQAAESIAGQMRSIHQFSKLVKVIVKEMDKEAKAEAVAMSAGDGSTGGAGAESSNFTSIMHNLIDQMLLGLKADQAAEHAIAAIKRGEKPVIALAGTMGSFIEDYADGASLKAGDALSLTFKDLMVKYLERSRDVTIRGPEGPPKKRALTDDELGPQGMAFYNSVKKMIRNARGVGEVPISPIDWIHYRMEQAGYKGGEITGRTHAVRYHKDGTPTYQPRSSKDTSIAGRQRVISGFNNGPLDYALINQAGSTGLSLHASEKFKDQRRRRMIIAQAEKNIDTFMQMLGRIFRTGEVVAPAYDQLVADIPAEKRPAAVLARKMASLNANTTGARGSKLASKDTLDFDNLYGDEAAASMMEDAPDLHEKLGEPLENDEDGLVRDGAARKITGRMAMLPVAEQEAFYELFGQTYQELLDRANALGENALEAKTLQLDAKEVGSTELFPGKAGEASPFAAGAYAKTMDVKRLGKPYTAEQVRERLAQNSGLPETTSMGNLQSVARLKWGERIKETQDAFQAYLNAERAKMDDSEMTDQQKEGRLGQINFQASQWLEAAKQLVPGNTYALRTLEGTTYYGVLQKIDRKAGVKNPVARGSWLAHFDVADGMREITFPFSKIAVEQAPAGFSGVRIERAWKHDLSNTPIMQLFDEGQTASREKRVVVTGNLLAGFSKVGRGQITNFTDHEGNVQQGVLMPRSFNLQDFAESQPVEMTNDVARKFLEATSQGLIRTGDRAVQIQNARGDYMIQTPRSKADGGKYFLDPQLRDLVGDFSSSSKFMYAHFPASELPAVLNLVSDKFDQRWYTDSFKEEAQRAGGTVLGKAAPAKALFARASLDSVLKRYGRQVASTNDAEIALADGDRVFAQHEQDDGVHEVFRPADLEGYTADQITVLSKYDPQPSRPKLALPARALSAPQRLRMRGDVHQYLKRVAKSLEGVARVYVHGTPKELGEWISQDLPDDVHGAYVADDGSLHFVASNIPNVATAQAIFRHEAFGHLAMERSPAFQKALDMVGRLKAMGGKRITDIWNDVAWRYPGADETTLRKEVIATMAERGLKNAIVDRAMDGARAILDDAGIHGTPTEADLRQMIMQAARGLPEEALKLSGLDRQYAYGIEAALARGDEGAALDAIGKILPESSALDALSAAKRAGDTRAVDVLKDLCLPLAPDTFLFDTMPTDLDALHPIEASVPKGVFFARHAPMDDATRAKMNRVIDDDGRDDMTLADRLRLAREAVRNLDGLAMLQHNVDDLASLERYERILNSGKLQEGSTSPTKMARSTRNLASVMTAVLEYGAPRWQDGAYQIVDGRKGLRDIFRPLTEHPDGSLMTHFQFYTAAVRAQRLIRERNPDGTLREKTFDQPTIDAGLALGRQYPELERVRSDYQTFNRHVLDEAQAAGVIDPEARAVYDRYGDYVPFYRANDTISGYRPGNASAGGITNQREMSGRLTGKAAPLRNVIENMIMNTVHLLDAAAKNRAGQAIAAMLKGVVMEAIPMDVEPVRISTEQVVRALNAAGFNVDPQMTPEQLARWQTFFRRVAPVGPDVTRVMYQGKPKYFRVLDPLLHDALTSWAGPPQWLKELDKFGWMSGPKRLVTMASTITPAFAIRSFQRDTLDTWMQSNYNTGIVKGAFQGFADSLKQHRDLYEIMMAGGGGGQRYDADPTAVRKMLMKNLGGRDADGFMSTVVSPKKWWASWQKVLQASENANRLREYRTARAAGKSVAEAAFQARDIEDFSMHGSGAVMQLINRYTPFLNARIQGTYRMYRGFRDNWRSYALRGGLVAAATLGLLALNIHNPKYQELPEWEKDSYWHIFLPGDVHLRIPRPFELGAIFATAPERIVRALVHAAGGEGGATPRETALSAAQAVVDTFAINPIPFAIRPIAEQAANYDMFRDRPIVSESESQDLPQAQYNPTTSPTIRSIAGSLPGNADYWLNSPARLDSLVRSYTSSIGATLLDGADKITRRGLGYSDAPSTNYTQSALESFVRTGEPHMTKYTDEMYTMLDRANKAYETVIKYSNEQRGEDARKVLLDNQKLIALRPMLNELGKDMKDLQRQQTAVLNSHELSSAEKREIVDRITKERNDLARKVAPFEDYF